MLFKLIYAFIYLVNSYLINEFSNDDPNNEYFKENFVFPYHSNSKRDFKYSIHFLAKSVFKIYNLYILITNLTCLNDMLSILSHGISFISTSRSPILY